VKREHEFGVKRESERIKRAEFLEEQRKVLEVLQS